LKILILCLKTQTVADFQGEEAAFTQYDERKYSTLQSHHFRDDTDYETIKHIHNNITKLGKQNDYCNMTMPSGRGHGFYSPITPEEGVIYAKVDKGKKIRRQRELNYLNTSSDSSVREGESDSISVETPLVTSEDGRSSSNSEDCKFNGIRTIKGYEDRESQV